MDTFKRFFVNSIRVEDIKAEDIGNCKSVTDEGVTYIIYTFTGESRWMMSVQPAYLNKQTDKVTTLAREVTVPMFRKADTDKEEFAQYIRENFREMVRQAFTNITREAN